MANFYGKQIRDVFSGTVKNDTLVGNGGNDHLMGMDGVDTLFGGIGDDKLDGGAGNDAVYGGDGKDFLSGGLGNDYMLGGFGDDYLWDLSGMDVMDGEAGNDRLVSTASGQVSGGAGNDVLVAQIGGALTAGAGHYTGGAGQDTLRLDNAPVAGAPKDYVFVDVTGSDADGMKGEAGRQDSVANSDYWVRTHSLNFDGASAIEVAENSALYYQGDMNTAGSLGNFSISGGASFDFMALGADNETVRGGGGADSFYVTGFLPTADGGLSYGTDRITDFNAAEGDTLLLGWGGTGTRVEVTEDAAHTYVTSYVDGRAGAVNVVVLDAVGVQNSIVTDWQTT